MSHFTVAVFSKGPDGVSDLLAPYDENIRVAPYIRYTRSQAIEAAKGFKVNEGKSDDELYEWMAEDYRDDDMIDEQGNLLSTYNPNSKWDYWIDYSGWVKNVLRLKDGSRDNKGPVNDVDFGRDEKAYREGLEFWDKYVEGGGKPDKDDFRTFYKPEYYIDQFGTRERYADVKSRCRTYAFVDAIGRWHQTGQMGWWGIDDATKDSRESYYREFDAYVEKAKADGLYVTVVDCHI